VNGGDIRWSRKIRSSSGCISPRPTSGTSCAEESPRRSDTLIPGRASVPSGVVLSTVPRDRRRPRTTDCLLIADA